MDKLIDLLFIGQTCPECLTEVSGDDSSWWCEGCGSTWEQTAREGGAPMTDPTPTRLIKTLLADARKAGAATARASPSKPSGSNHGGSPR